MVDSRQAVERARRVAETFGDHADAEQLARDVLALAAALADTERERDEAQKWANTMEHERDWEQQVVHSELLGRAEAAEARVAELQAALRRIRDEAEFGPETERYYLAIARRALAAHPSGCAKPGGEQ